MTWHVGGDSAWCERLCLTLMHSLWQAAALAALASLAERLWRGLSLERRYALHVTALLLALAALPVTFGLVAAGPPHASPSPTQAGDPGPILSPAVPSGGEIRSTAPATDSPAAASSSAVDGPHLVAEMPVVAVRATEPASGDAWEHWRNWSPWIVGAYAAGVAAMLGRLAYAVFGVQRLAARAQPVVEGPLVAALRELAERWSVRVVPALAIVKQSCGPALIGFFRPMILLPATAVSGLSPHELELILAHELAHVRRHDAWILLVQRLAEAVLFFHPALWHLSRRISQLREYCCDELACQGTARATTERRIDYAQTLLRVVELAGVTNAAGDRLAALAASGRSPSELRRRVARLLGSPLREPLCLSRGGLCALLLLTAAIALGLPAWDSAAQQPPETEPTAEEEGSMVFRLLVVGPDGAPVPEASVEIRTDSVPTAEQIVTGTLVRSHQYGMNALCNEEGVFSLRLAENPQSFHVFVIQPGFGPYGASWNSYAHPDPLPAEFTAALDAAWTIGGIVVDEVGNPVEGVRIRPSIAFKQRPEDANSGLHIHSQVVTDARGAWRFESVPIALDALYVWFDHADFAPYSQEVTRSKFEVAVGSEPTARIELPAGQEITGVITDEEGNPLENAIVRSEFGSPPRAVTTDAAGRYRLPNAPLRNTWLVVSAPGRASVMQDVDVKREQGPVDFVLQAGRTVRVRVVDEQGRGIAGAAISPRHSAQFIDYFDSYLPRQTTDAAGAWEWHEAPVGEFQVSIQLAGRMQITRKQVIAREEEYVLTLPPELVIHGRVIDAQTQEPIESFRVVPGERGRPEYASDDFWQYGEGYVARDGAYRITRTRGDTPHMLRIEAHGYQSYVSRDIDWDEGDVTLDVALTPAADVRIIVLTPDGQPAIGAKAVVGVAGTRVVLQNGEFSERAFDAPRIEVDADGVVGFPLPTEAFQVLITHASGFAYWRSTDGLPPEQVLLTSWARVEGTVRVGPKLARQAAVMLFANAPLMESGEPFFAFISYEAVTDEDGQFVFERVLPGEGRVGRRIEVPTRFGGTLQTSSNSIAADFMAGQTTRVEIGGLGRPVTGRLLPRPGYAEAMDWEQFLVRIEYGRELPPQPAPPEELRNDRERVRAWYAEWMQTEEGQTWSAAYEQHSAAREKSAYVSAAVDRDGAFRLEDVPPGDYFLNAEVSDRRRDSMDGPGVLIHYFFTVPEMDEPLSTEPLDLGTLTLEPLPAEEVRPRPGN